MMSDIGHNSGDYAPAGEQLLEIIERYESLDQAKRDISGDQKDLMASAKESGFDTKVIRKLVALRKRDAEEVAKEEGLLEAYKAAIGMV